MWLKRLKTIIGLEIHPEEVSLRSTLRGGTLPSIVLLII